MTDPANAASREARAVELLGERFGLGRDVAFLKIMRDAETNAIYRYAVGVVVDLLALADEAASQPREGVKQAFRAGFKQGAVDKHYRATETTAWNDWAPPLDTAPTDQAQGGGEREAFAAGFEAGQDLEAHYSRGLSTDPHVDDENEAWAKFVARRTDAHRTHGEHSPVNDEAPLPNRAMAEKRAERDKLQANVNRFLANAADDAGFEYARADIPGVMAELAPGWRYTDTTAVGARHPRVTLTGFARLIPFAPEDAQWPVT